jgi:hypothetical protein
MDIFNVLRSFRNDAFHGCRWKDATIDCFISCFSGCYLFAARTGTVAAIPSRIPEIDVFLAKYLQQCNATHKIMNIVMGLWA